MTYTKDSKFYFGPNTFSRKPERDLSLGMIGLLEKYSTMVAFDILKHPWVTIEDISNWCKDDEESIENYIEEGIEKKCLIPLNEQEALRLQKDPLHNCWLYE